MIRLTRARHVALACLVASGAAFACNAIIGVQDVKLRKGTTKDGGAVGGDDEDDDVDANEPIDSATKRPNVLTVVLGEAHSCARKVDGTVKCWGDDSQGQTGSLGTQSDAGVVANPVPVAGMTNAIDIAAGRRHTCVAQSDGKVSCWGGNEAGQLGNNKIGEKSNKPEEVIGISNAFAVAAGGNFSCAVRGSGTVACWGGNGDGQLGRGDSTPSGTPVVVSDLTNVVQVSAGQAHACAVKGDGSVLCWGRGVNGQLGGGKTENSLTPALVASLPKAVAVTAGERSTCALTEPGGVLCWGANEVGQLGSGAPNTNPNPSPISVQDPKEGALAIATGRNHTCAVRSGNTVLCWGEGTFGQLGDDLVHDAGTAQAKGTPVAKLTEAFRIGAGSNHSCATTSSDKIMCWGANESGQLGSGGTTSTRAPVAVQGF